MSRLAVTRVASVNMKTTVPGPEAEAGLRSVLELDPEIVALQEWGGARRYAILNKLGRFSIYPQSRSLLPLLPTYRPGEGYLWTRPVGGGGVIGFAATRFEIRWVNTRILVGPGRVDVVPGYRTNLGPSLVNVTIAYDNLIRDEVVVIDYHLTTHVQASGSYRPEVPKRVARHQAEVAKLQTIAAGHVRAGRRVYVIGDSNYHGLQLDGLVSCWDGVPRVAGGTHGPRRIDIIHSQHAPGGGDGDGIVAPLVAIAGTASDHRHPVFDYVDPIR